MNEFSNARRTVWILLTVLLLHPSLFAQIPLTGSISGKVVDSVTRDPIVGANVYLPGTTVGAATDPEGEFLIRSLAPGTYSVVLSFISYASVRMDSVVVHPGQTTRLDVAMKEEVIQTKEIVVEGKGVMSFEGALLTHQKKMAVISDGISAEQIRRSPDATAGDALRRVTGVTVADGRFLYVRGTSERYSRALLNNASLSSTEPDKKAFAFDLLPTNLLQSAVIAKSFTPDVPGDFSGGLLRLTTVDFPDDLVVNITTSVGYVSSTTFQAFQRSSGGTLDALGIDDGTRALPASFPKNLNSRLFSAEELHSFARSLRNSWAPANSRALTNNSFALSMGDGTRLLGENFGFVAALSYRNNFDHSETVRREYESSGEPRFAFDGQQWTSSVLWGALLNVGYDAGPGQRFTLKNSYTRSANEEVAQLSGFQFADAGSEQIQTAIRFVSRSVLASQITGEHASVLGSPVNVHWRVFGSLSTRDEPDYRRIIYARPIGTSEPMAAVLGFQANLKNGGRYFSELDDHSLGSAVDASIPFAGGTFKAGAQLEHKTREFRSRLIGVIVNARNNGYTDPALYELPLDRIFSAENFRYNGFSIDEYQNGTNAYDAGESIAAAYAMIDIPMASVIDGLRIIAGARFEHARHSVQSYDVSGRVPVSIELVTPDLLPSINLVYGLSPSSNVRAAYSETVNRPELRELAPFAYFDFNTQTSIRGNQQLTRARIRNYDFRYESYPGPGELFSVSVFYKNLRNAIEQVVVTGSALGSERTFANADMANVYGLEIEARLSLGHLADVFAPLTLRSNLTLVKSAVTVSGTESTIARKGRPLQGQSPYVWNLGLQYTHVHSGISANLLYNTYGRRVVEVATAYEQDVIEEPRDVLDLAVTIPVASGYDVKLQWKDILHPDRVFRQADRIARSDSMPSSVSIGLSITP